MPKIIVFHYTEPARVPALSAAECAAIRENFDRVVREYDNVTFHGVFAGADGRAICEWEAPDAATVEKIITRVEGQPSRDGAVLVTRII